MRLILILPLVAHLSNWPAVRAQYDESDEVSSTTLAQVPSDLLQVSTFASELSDLATMATFNGPEATSDLPTFDSTTSNQAEPESTTASTTTDGSLPDFNPVVDSQPAEEPANTTTTTLSPLQNDTVVQQDTSVVTTTSETTTQVPETTTTPTSTTTKPGVETTPTEKRTTLPATTGTTPIHECVTSMSCVDPNAHCVSIAGRNTCQCRTGYRRNHTGGACLQLPTEAPSTTTARPVSSTTTNQPLDVGTTTASKHPGLSQPKVPLVKLTDLEGDDDLDVVTLSLEPAVSVVEWLFEKDLLFRTTVAEILSNIDLQTSNEEPQSISISADRVLYLAPSPLAVNDRLLVSILVENSNQIPEMPYSVKEIVAKRRRRSLSPVNDTIPRYFPATWIVTSIRKEQEMLENNLNQSVLTLYGGVIPEQLFQPEHYATATLLERRLDIFIPLILAITLSCMVIVSLVCVRAKKRTTATWDPPAGIIFGRVQPQTGVGKEREDPLGSTNRLHSSGQDLATDEQCREGEDLHPVKPGRLNSEDDVWVVPFEDAPSGASTNAIRTQFEDTKL